MLRTVWICLVMSAFLSNAQVSGVIGVRQVGLANSGHLLSGVWSVKNNPGAFGFFKGTVVGVQYTDRFLIPELASKHLIVGHQSKSGNIGLFIQQTGFELFNQLEAGVAYGLKLSEYLGVGVNLNYHLITLGDIYGQRHNVSAGLGIKYLFNNDLAFGASVRNINRAKISDFQDERLPTVFILSSMYKVSKKTIVMVDLEKEITQRVNLKAGLEVKANKMFDVRLGVNTYPFQSAFGVGIRIRNLNIDLASVWHSQLGISPTLGLVYVFK